MSDTSTASAAEAGLTTLEARRRLRQLGPNRVAEQGEVPLWQLALGQFRSLVVLLLLAVSGISGRWANGPGGGDPRRARAERGHWLRLRVGRDGPGASASTMAFTALVLIHPFQAMSCRSERLNWWQLRPNPWIPLSLVALFALQWFAITWGPLARVLGTTPLTGTDWLAVALGVLWPVALLEAVKAWGRFTTVRLADPTAATRAGPPSSITFRKN